MDGQTEVDTPGTGSLTASSSSEDWTMLETTTLKTDNGTEEGRKKRNDSYRSNGSVDDSSDGISVISESDANHEKILDDDLDHHRPTVHFVGEIDLKSMPYEPVTPPFSPSDVQLVPEEEPEASGDEDEQNRTMQIQSTADKSVETVHALVEHRHPPVSNASWILFGVVATAMAAILLGNSMRLQNRVDEINFEHEKRISELELENNILKNEMRQLRHLYTRSELDEQVQQAEHEWMAGQREEQDGEPEVEEEMPPATAEPEETPVRKVPPQDAGVKRKVVWSGDDDGPMLIVDKDYVLPEFCYKQDNAVQDDLFAEYSAKYCDVKKRKVEARQRKQEMKHRKAAGKEEDYGKYIRQKVGKGAEKPSEQVKPVSPFNIDYQKAFEAIKSEGSVIVEALSSILDLSPEPEEPLEDSSAGDVSPAPNSADDSPKPAPPQDRQQHDDRGHYKKDHGGKRIEGSGGKQRSEYQKRKDYREHNGEHKEQRQEFVKDEKRREGKHYDNGSGASKEQRRNGKEQEYHKKPDYQHNANVERQFKKRDDKLAGNDREEGSAQHADHGSGERKYKKHDNGKEDRQKDNHHKTQHDQEERKDHQKKMHRHDHDDDDHKKHHDRDDDHHKKHHNKDEHHQNRNHDNDRNNGSGDHRDSQKKHHHDDNDHHKRHHDRDDDDDDHHKKRHHDRDDDADNHHKKRHHDRDDDDHDHHKKKHHDKNQQDHHRNDGYRKDRDHDHDHDHQRRKHRQDGGSGHDWHEKRHKGREEYREKNFKKDRDWHEQMMHGREEAREDNRQRMVQDSNWYLERGNQREEERTVQHGA